MAGDSLPTLLAGDSLATYLAGDSLPAFLAGDSLPAFLAGDSLPTVLAGDSLPTVLAGDSLPTYLAGESLPEDLGGDSLTAPFAGESLPVDLGGDSLVLPDSSLVSAGNPSSSSIVDFAHCGFFLPNFEPNKIIVGKVFVLILFNAKLAKWVICLSCSFALDSTDQLRDARVLSCACSLAQLTPWCKRKQSHGIHISLC